MFLLIYLFLYILNSIFSLSLQGTQEEWQRVFFVCAALSAFGGIFFAFFAKGDIQPWAIQEKSTVQRERRRSLYMLKTRVSTL